MPLDDTQAQLDKHLEASSLFVYKCEIGWGQLRVDQLEQTNAVLQLRKRAALRRLEALTEKSATVASSIGADERQLRQSA